MGFFTCYLKSVYSCMLYHLVCVAGGWQCSVGRRKSIGFERRNLREKDSSQFCLIAFPIAFRRAPTSSFAVYILFVRIGWMTTPLATIICANK
jgi:hypothetical protein